MSSRRWIAAAAFLTGAGVAAFAAWSWFLRSQEPVLEREWMGAAFVVAGDGRAGTRDGRASSARFSDPFGVAVARDGTVFVADAGDAQSIRRISPDGAVSTIATGFDTPSGLAIDAEGVLYLADTGNNAIRRVAQDGTVSTVAEGFNGPVGVAVGAAGRIIVADTYNDRIRAIERDGTIVTITQEYFDTPCGVAADAAGNIYVAETGAGAVRMISPAGVVTTVEPVPLDGLFRPVGIAVDPAGVLYVTDDRGRIIEITPGAGARTIIGSRTGFKDGAGADALLRGPAGIAIAGDARLIVTEPRNAIVRLVAARSQVELRPPSAPDIKPAFDTASFAREPLLWPLAPLDGPFEITGTLGEPRGSEGERFHAGIDVHAGQGTPVRAARAGVVRDPISTSGFGGLNESVRIGPLTYVHIRVGRLFGDEVVDLERFVASYDETGRLTHVRVKRGARFSAGEVIGSANAFNHVHLNVGWSGEELNPLHFRLTQLADTVAPTIARGGVRLFREDGQIVPRKGGRLIVDGAIRIVVDAWDQVDGNEARRRLGLYRLGYQILNRDGSAAPGYEETRETLVFDRISSDPEAPHVVYATGSGIPFYGRRSTRFLYVVTNTLRGGVASPGVWDTTALPPGDYTLRVLAADIHGNVATANRDVAVTIAR